MIMPNLQNNGYTNRLVTSMATKMAKNAVFNAILAEYWLYRPSGDKYGQKSGTAVDKKERGRILAIPLFFISSLTYADREP